MLDIPLSPVAAQTVSTVVDGQNCAIAIYTKSTGMFFDLSVDGIPIITCRIIRDAVNLVRSSLFRGDFQMLDTQGNDDPQYTGLGGRWVLVFNSAS